MSRNSKPGRAKPKHPLRTASRYLFLAIVVIAPWTYGGVYYQTQVFLYAGLLICGLMWLCSHLCESDRSRTRFQFPLLILPIALGVILGTVQLIPLSSAEHRSLGPPVGDDMPVDPEVAGFERQSLSIYPLQTRVTIASLSFALLAFFLASQLFSSHKSQLLLFGAVALSGLALSFFGLVQKLSWERWDHHLFWFGAQVIDGKPFAAWVNRNNAAGFLNMTFAAALGMLVWASYHKHSKSKFEYDLISDGWGGGILERLHGYFARLGRLRGSQLLFGLSLAVIAAGVIGSASRGGILSLGAGLFAALAWFVAKGQTRMATVIGLIVLIPSVGLLSWLGISGSVGARFAELGGPSFKQTARFQNWSDTLQGLPDIWIAGSGLGTYEYFHRPYQQHKSEGIYVHAENQYVQALIEGGAVGLGLLILAILLGYAAVARLSSSRMIPQEDGVALVGLVALTTQFCHSFLDFGLMLPANMLLMAVLMGAVSGRAAHKLAGGRGSWRITFPRMNSKIVPALFAVLLLGNGALGWTEISRAAIAEKTVLQVERTQQAPTTPESAQKEIDRLLSALTYRPDDAELLLALSEAYVLTYQLSVKEELESRLPPDRKLSPRQLAAQSSLAALYDRASELERDDKRFQLDHLKSRPIVRETLVPARSVLLAAKSACEWSPKIELSLAFLSVLEEPLEKRIEHLERVVYLASYEPRYLYAVGYLARASGDDELCLFAWKRAFKLSPQLRFEILMQIKRFYPKLSLSRDFLPRDPSILRYAVEYPMIQKAHPEILEEVLDCVDDMLSTEHNAVSVDELFLNGFRKKWRGESEAAIVPLEEALRRDPADLNVRILAIELLIEVADAGHPDRLDRAEDHLAHAQSYMTSFGDYERLSILLEKKRDELKTERAGREAAAGHAKVDAEDELAQEEQPND
jgi:hypothetical protein